MARKYSVLMAQPNYQYGRNVFIPYSVGSLQAYAQTFPEIQENFGFQQPLFRRTDPMEVLRGIEEPTIVCLSCYLWNWEYNKALARAIRAVYPNCLIVFGGTQVPTASEGCGSRTPLVNLTVSGTGRTESPATPGFFAQHPYVDLLVHHEGELIFLEILREFLGEKNFTRIPGLSVRVEGNRTVKTPPASRIRDLSKLPSPYLAGIFDFMLKSDDVLNASQETNRGCPFPCTFCDWGNVAFDKVMVFDEGRLLEEFEWFGQRRVEYLFSCDANYGSLPRDVELTEKMIATRAKHNGYPLKFRMCTAKNSGQKIFVIAKMLHKAGMDKGATLSFQSMDQQTLENVKRKNISLATFHELMYQYRQEGIATYTELIIGMPGETYESTKRGVDTLIDGQDDAINLFAYPCGMLPNSEMSEPAYVKQHQIGSVRMPILLAHSTPEPESLAEYLDTVVETATMSRANWQRTYVFYWAIQVFHCLGLLQHIAIVCRRLSEIPYSEFYERLIEYFATQENTLIGEQIALVRRIVERSLSGGRLDLVLPRFGGIYWPLEEASFLVLVAEKERFYREVSPFVALMLQSGAQTADSNFQDNLLRYESAVIKDPHGSETTLTLDYDLHGYFSRPASWGIFPLKSRSLVRIKPEPCFDGDLESYAKEVVWYGRKGGKFHHSDIISETALV